METIRYDAHFGTVIERPARRKRCAAKPRSAGPAGAWTWLAERDGEPVGLLLRRATGGRGLDRADGRRRRPSPTCELMFVLPGERGAASARRAGRAAAPRGRDAAGRGGHPAALRAGQPAVRAVLEPAGIPAAVDHLGGQAGPHAPLSSGRPLGQCCAGPALSLSRWIWKNGDCRTNRATSISSSAGDDDADQRPELRSPARPGSRLGQDPAEEAGRAERQDAEDQRVPQRGEQPAPVVHHRWPARSGCRRSRTAGRSRRSRR